MTKDSLKIPLDEDVKDIVKKGVLIATNMSSVSQLGKQIASVENALFVTGGLMIPSIVIPILVKRSDSGFLMDTALNISATLYGFAQRRPYQSNATPMTLFLLARTMSWLLLN